MRNPWKPLVLLFVFLTLCSNYVKSCFKDNCYNCDSCLCHDDLVNNISCSHQLVSQENGSSCLLRKVNRDEKEKDLTLHPWMDLYPVENRPFLLQAYFQKDSFSRTAFNITFYNLLSTDLRYRFRFRNLANPCEDLGREFILKNLPILPPSSNQVFWDCPFFNGYSGKDLTLTVVDDRGSGGEYSFVVPDLNRINPDTVSIRNWQLFLMLDVGHYKTHHKAAVTMQVAPFNNLTYRIKLHCCQKKNTCSNGTLIDSHQFQVPDLENQIGVPWPHKTVQFALPRTCIYRITAQILHSDCPAEGCYLSQSPVFELEPSCLLLNIMLCGAALFVFIIIMGLLYLRKRKHHIELMSNLSNHPTSLLLIYLSETKAHFDLVKTLAAFLRDTCFVDTLLVDTDASQKNPNEWTVNYMAEADRVVFLVPSNHHGESITPVQKQWQSSLSYFADSYFIRYSIHKVATLLIPSVSAPLPAEIASLRRFHLMQDMTSFVTWIHDGTYLDKWLLWRSRVTSDTSKTTMSHLKDSINNLLKENQVSTVPQKENNFFSYCKVNGDASSQSALLSVPEQHPLDSEDEDVICTKVPGDEFDPNIQSVENLLLSQEQNLDDQNDDTQSFCDGNNELSDMLFERH